MFGFNKLTHDGTAVVVSLSNAAHSMAVKGNGLTKTNYDLIVDVYPVGAAPFRAETSHWFAIWLSPNPGDQLKVRCNPETHKVKIDISDDPRFNEDLHRQVAADTREAQRQADLAAPPGTRPSSQSPSSYPDAMLDPELQELVRLEEQERRWQDPPAAH
jgi:hypothetical protein